MVLVRVSLTDTSDEYDPFSVDLFVDCRGMVDDRIQTYGRWGKISGDDVWPFMLRPNVGKGDARLDFGTDAATPLSDKERFAWTNLVSKRVAHGEFVTVRYAEDEICFRAAQIKELPSGEDFKPD